MRKLIVVLLALFVAYAGLDGIRQPERASVPEKARAPAVTLSAAQNGQVVSGEGTVLRMLADDREGSPHQRFILRLTSGQTVLIAHNIDLAPRLAPLAAGDVVAFRGEFVWTEQGGTVHWTHHDPAGRHEAGWLRRGDRTVQ